MPMYAQTDLNIQHRFKFGGGRQVQLELNVSNLLNQRTAINKNMTEHKTNGISFDERSFYLDQVDFAPLLAVMPKNPQFLKDSGFQTPLSARVGVRFLF